MIGRAAIPIALLAATVTASPIPAAAGGYGRFRWGETLQDVKKKQKRLRVRTDVEPVALERRALRAVTEAAKAKAKKEGREAMRALRKRPKPKPRLSAYSYWVRLADLPAQVVLQFADERLYAAEVGVLYKSEQTGGVQEILAHVQDKYGAPAETRKAPDSPARAWTFDTEDGTLDALEQPPTEEGRGMLTLSYRARNLAVGVDRYVEGLRGRIRQLEQEKAERAAARDEEAEDARLKAIREHL